MGELPRAFLGLAGLALVGASAVIVGNGDFDLGLAALALGAFAWARVIAPKT
jgi:hypothetical protein